MSLVDILIRWRQRAYPAPFRIYAPKSSEWQQALVRSLSHLTAPPQEPPGPSGPPRAIPDMLAVALCNNHFWIGCQIGQMEKEGIDSAETRNVKRCLDALKSALEKNDILSIDLTTQGYHAGRLDFEAFGKPEVRPGLAYSIITMCESPVVMSGRRLLQKARGTIAKPQ